MKKNKAGRPVNVEKVNKMKELYAKTGSVGVVAKHLGCTAVNVWLTLKRHGVKIQNPRKRRSAGEIRKVVALYNKTGNLSKVAKKLKCTESNVSYLFKRHGFEIVRG